MTKTVRALIVFILAGAPSVVSAQQSAQERAARLRAQLAEIQARQTDLQTRLAQIDEDIKPENIERSLAGVGSVHPEELRAARRRQLEIQRKGIESQLDSLAATSTHLQSAIAAADAESYRQTVGPNLNSIPNATNRSIRPSHRQKRQLKRHRTKRS